MDGVICRRATADDYQGVMDIGEAFQAMDYLPHLYHQYLKDPMVHSYVCEKDGDIIAYKYVLVVDGGRAVIIGGARTKAGYRNTKSQDRMMEYFHKDVGPTLGPSYDTLYTGWNHELAMKLIMHKCFKIIQWRGTTGYDSTTQKMGLLFEKLKLKIKQHQVQKLTSDQVKTTILDPQTKQYLFPGNRIVIFYETYEVTEENLSYILREYNTVFFAVTLGSQCSSVACFTTLPTSYGLRCDFEYYGDSFDEWIFLFVQGLQYLSSLSYQGKVCIPMFFPAHWDDGQLKGWLKENCGWEVGPWDWTQYKYQITVNIGKCLTDRTLVAQTVNKL